MSAVRLERQLALERDVPRVQRAFVQVGRDHVEGRVLQRAPATGMMPFDGMSSSAGAGKPAAIEPARWKPLAAEPE